MKYPDHDRPSEDALFAARKLRASASTDPPWADGELPRGDEPPELTLKENAILDEIWAELRAESFERKPVPIMSDQETLEFFGLDIKTR